MGAARFSRAVGTGLSKAFGPTDLSTQRLWSSLSSLRRRVGTSATWGARAWAPAPSFIDRGEGRGYGLLCSKAPPAEVGGQVVQSVKPL